MSVRPNCGNAMLYARANWIDKTFEVKTINVISDTLDNGNRPRLQIIFENYSEAAKFRTNSGYDEEKQQMIVKKLENLEALKKSFWRFFIPQNKKVKNTFVIFSAFEPIARWEANELIPESKIEKLKIDLHIPSIWKIYRQFAGTTIFCYTEAQVEEISKNSLKEFLASKYFELLKQYDEFNYFIKDTYYINFDSKENFDSNYGSNWFNYDKR